MDAHGNPSTPPEVVNWLSNHTTSDEVLALVRKLDEAVEGASHATIILALLTKVGIHCADGLGKPHPLLAEAVALMLGRSWSAAAELGGGQVGHA